MLVVLIRHGHKGHLPFQDPELTPQGFDQALHLAELATSGIIPPPTHCWYSDKIRTRQTLSEVILKFNPVCTETKMLSTRMTTQTQTDFRKNVQDFITLLNQKATAKKADQKIEVHFACTHFDWIEESLSMIPCDQDLNSFQFANWSPGQFLIFELAKIDLVKTELTKKVVAPGDQLVWKVKSKGVLK